MADMPHLMSLPTNILQGLWPEARLFMGLRVSRRLQAVLGWWGDEGPGGEEVDREVELRVKQQPFDDPVSERDGSVIRSAAATLAKLHWRAYVEFSGPLGGLGQFLVATRGRGADRIDTLEWVCCQWESDDDDAWPEESYRALRDARDARVFGTLLLAEGLRGASKLQNLYLRTCFAQMKDAHVARSLFDAISTCSRLKALDLSENGLVGAVIKRAAVCSRTSEERAHCKAPAGMDAYFLALQVHVAKACPRSCAARADLHCVQRLQDCMSALTKLTGLEDLVLDCNEMDSDDCRHLSAALPKMRLTGLQLAMVGMGDEGAHELAKGLSLCTNMTSLSLGHSDYHDRALAREELCGCLGSLGGAGLARCLPRMPDLVELYLNMVVFEDEAVAGLATGLAGCGKLKILCMDRCRLSDKGATGLAPALARLTSLEELDLWRNAFKSDGALAVANELPGLASLKELSLQSAEMSPDGLCSLADAVRSGAAERPVLCLNLSLRDLELGSQAEILDPDDGALQDLIHAMSPPQPSFLRALSVYHPFPTGDEAVLERTAALLELAETCRVRLELYRINDQG